MTDTEAKALAIRASYGLTPYESGVLHDYIEATEARHAAEMREQAERFSEAAKAVLHQMRANQLLQASLQPILASFILPSPDPVSEWLAECSDSRVSNHTMTMLRLFHNWLSEKETRKIGEAGE